MQKNFFDIDENQTVGTFLKEVSDKKNMQYIILDTEPKSFVDVRTIALKMHQPNEKLKGLKKPLSESKGKNNSEHTQHLIETGDRIILTKDGYFDFLEAIDEILSKNFDFLEKPLNEISRKEIFALSENDKISNAKSFFVQKRVNLLPVIDKLKILGEVRTMDLLVSDLLNADKNDNKANYYDDNYESSVWNLPISNIMNQRPLTVPHDAKIKNVLELMKNKKIPSLIVENNGNLHSVISYKDIFKLVKKDLETGEYTLEYNGSGNLYDDEFDLIQDFVEKSMKKITKLSDYNMLKIFFKIHGNTKGSHQKKFEVSLNLSCGNKVIHVDKEIVGGTSDEISNDKVKGKWNVPLTVQEALKVLEKKVLEEKRKNKN